MSCLVVIIAYRVNEGGVDSYFAVSSSVMQEGHSKPASQVKPVTS